MKKATYIRYVLAKLSKFVKLSPQTSSHSFLWRIIWKLKGPRTSSQASFFIQFFDKKFSFVILHKLAKFHYKTVYFPSYSIKRVSYFMHRHLMTSWHLNIWKIKIWLSQEWKELSKWNEKHLSLFHKFSLLDMQNKLVKL